MKGLELVVESAIEVNVIERASVSCLMVQVAGTNNYTIWLTDDAGRAASLFTVSSYKSARQLRHDVREVIDNMKPPKVTGGVHYMGEKSAAAAMAEVRKMISDQAIEAQFTYSLPERFEHCTLDSYDKPQYADSGLPGRISMQLVYGGMPDFNMCFVREYEDTEGMYDAMIRDVASYLFMIHGVHG